MPEKIPRAFAQSVGLFNKIITSVSLAMSVCIELCPSNATKAPPISTPTASVEASYFHLHPPLLASKAVLSSWSLVVVCALTTTCVTGITGWYRLVLRTIREHIIYVRIYGIYVQVPRGSPVAFLSCVVRMNIWMRTLCDVRRTGTCDQTVMDLLFTRLLLRTYKW